MKKKNERKKDKPDVDEKRREGIGEDSTRSISRRRGVHYFLRLSRAQRKRELDNLEKKFP